ncbi:MULTISPECIES: YbaN family protein [unclassified Lonepinella]|uniref:YbaN family protein n=1 Tax=unclassified Lonepinella TaxID=2642006 RepID=UPI003F6DD795
MRFLYIGLGFLCIGLGVIGAFLPVMPTTPFLLLALFFFGKSSPRLHAWFLQTDIYKKHLKSFDEQRALTKKSKISILTLSTVMMAISFYFTPIYGRICIVILLLIEYWFFFFWIKTLDEK